MRATITIPLLLLAACSGDAGADQKAKADTDKAALALAGGQWETTTEFTQITSQDNGEPVLKAGEKIVASTCVGEGEGKKPPAVVLAGVKEGSCSYDNLYMSRGRLNATISCTQPGLAGKLMVSADGSYTADSFETAGDVQTYLTTDGDARGAAKITGRRTGACAPADAKV